MQSVSSISFFDGEAFERAKEHPSCSGNIKILCLMCWELKEKGQKSRIKIFCQLISMGFLHYKQTDLAFMIKLVSVWNKCFFGHLCKSLQAVQVLTL